MGTHLNCIDLYLPMQKVHFKKKKKKKTAKDLSNNAYAIFLYVFLFSDFLLFV